MGELLVDDTPGSGGLVIPDRASLGPMDVPRRVAAVCEGLDAAGVDALVVTNLTNIRYLTGFTGSAGVAVVTGDALVFITDGRYTTQSGDEIGAAGVDAAISIIGGAGEQARAVAAAVGSSNRVGLEADHVSWAMQRRVATEWLPEVELVATSAVVERLRMVKDPGEVDRMAMAAAIADVAFTRLRHRLADRPTEAEFALELDTEMRRLGADDLSFETIVASGPNAARPHHRPGRRTVVPGDLVVCDFGALIDGYHSDMTRTVWVGEPDATKRRMWDVVAEAQAAGRDTVAAGVTTGAVDAECRTVIAAAGWEDAFVHSTGHGVGLDIHEAPRVGNAGDDTLGEGWVITVEPGVYLADIGGVRIEDTVVVQAGGCRPLTLAPKDPVV